MAILADQAAKVIRRIEYSTVATADEEGHPWNSPVFGVYDEKVNFFWGSHRGSQHSKNIGKKGEAFLTIYDSTVPTGEGAGVYIEAEVSELDQTKDVEFAYSLLLKKCPTYPWSIEEVQNNGRIRIYKAAPRQIWMNGEGEIDGSYVDTREGIPLSDLAARLKQSA